MSAPAPHAAPPQMSSPSGRDPAETRSHASSFDAKLHRSYRVFYALRQWLWRHVTPAGALLFWAMLAAGSFTDVGQTMAHQFFGVLFSLLAVALVWVRKPKNAFAIERLQLPRYTTCLTPFTYRVRIRNLTRRWKRGTEFWEGTPDPRPTLAQFATLEEPGESRRNWFDRRYRFYRWSWLCERGARARLKPVPIPDVAPESHVDLELQILPLRRGRLTLVGAEIARLDPFALFRRLAVVKETAGVVRVFPRRFTLPHFDLPGASRRLQNGGVAFAGSIGDSEEFISAREYRPGDPLRRIHWAGWARAQRPVVKEFQEEYFVRHALLLDTFAHGPQLEAFEEAISLAASFACTVDQRDSLLDLMFVGEKAYVFTGGRGVAHSEQLLEVLADVDPTPQGSIASLESLVLNHTSQLSGCILIFLDWDESRRRLREQLESRRVPTLTFVVLSDPTAPRPELPPGVHALPAGRVQETLHALSRPDQTASTTAVP